MTSFDPETLLALSYAPAEARDGLEALLRLDETLGNVLRTTREPALGQIRLAWWRERIEALDAGPPAGEPVLKGVHRHALRSGVTGASLAPMAEGWELLLLRGEDDAGWLERFGALRGSTLFAAAGASLGAGSDPLAEAGRGWALADLARHLSDTDEAAAAREAAGPLLDRALAKRWSRQGRALGALAHLARIDLALAPGAARPIGAPGRVWRLMRHRLTGR